jgi:hypothetical protein
MRIKYKCLVPIYVFPEMKLCSLVISKTELECSVSQFLHSARDLYISKDRSVYFAAAKYVDRSWEHIMIFIPHRHMNVGIGTEADQFLFWECIK